ncbi:MAG: hypothetical protein ABS49_05845 [Erythrobacter sp. SCN 62-14]|nr:MAG: hypothetical protein ABS49_05845 [Erythrobacter sp. SCN 62-14]
MRALRQAGAVPLPYPHALRHDRQMMIDPPACRDAVFSKWCVWVGFSLIASVSPVLNFSFLVMNLNGAR